MSAKRSHMMFFDLQRTRTRLKGGWIVELRDRLLARRCAPEPQSHELAGCVGVQYPYNVVLAECAADQT